MEEGEKEDAAAAKEGMRKPSLKRAQLPEPSVGQEPPARAARGAA